MPRNVVRGPLADRAREARVEALVRLRRDYASLDPIHASTIHDAVAALLILDVDAVSIARKAEVATPTVTRWSQGVGNPHPLARRAVLAALMEVADDEIGAARDEVPA